MPERPPWAAHEAALCSPPMVPSNHSTVALAQEWFAELDGWLDAHPLRGYDPFDVKQHRWIRAAQPHPLARRMSTLITDIAPITSRRMLKVPTTDNPKAYALAALGKLRLYQLTQNEAAFRQAGHYLEQLLQLRNGGFAQYCWGYPFAIHAQGLHTPAGTPIAVLSAVAGQAFSLAWLLGGDAAHLDAAQSIARGMMEIFPRIPAGEGQHCFAYSPADMRRVHNANLLVAEHLFRMGSLTGDTTFTEAALPALQYTLRRQRDDGAWPYGEAAPGDGYDPKLQAIVDHHHTGFVLRSLLAIRTITDDATLEPPLRTGFGFYKRHLLLPGGAPTTGHGVYPIDIHACAEAILCPSVLSREVLAARTAADAPLRWTYANMRHPHTGLPYYRKYPMFTSRIHFPRWGTTWLYYALSEYLLAHHKRG